MRASATESFVSYTTRKNKNRRIQRALKRYELQIKKNFDTKCATKVTIQLQLLNMRTETYLENAWKDYLFQFNSAKGL